MQRITQTIIPIIIIGALTYTFRTEIHILGLQLVQTVAPCTVPISYRIGSIDSRFGISNAQVLDALRHAESTWEKVAGRDLFRYVPEGDAVITVRFVYDKRQATTERLKDIGLSLDSDLASYHALEAKYRTYKSAYESKHSTIEQESAAFTARASAYEREVKMWNARGGVNASAAERLDRERSALESIQADLEARSRTLQKDADTVNALVDELNHMARALNSNVATYNKVGTSVGDEFEEALYEKRAGQESIEVYEFDGPERLRRVLAHEFGHALDIEHVDDNRAIMYRLNQGTNQVPTRADIEALQSVCHFAKK
ncbi:matrixin family metalloprotease [Candidatus Kaiserbacteria bacterium]|nr:matrixin family metalloprotease [Candidatus Kaiserbacteria bacterium]